MLCDDAHFIRTVLPLFCSEEPEPDPVPVLQVARQAVQHVQELSRGDLDTEQQELAQEETDVFDSKA